MPIGITYANAHVEKNWLTLDHFWPLNLILSSVHLNKNNMSFIFLIGRGDQFC